MKPLIFVSSTFYDLKYIREDLSNFIKAHDFEPIMFENGDIGYIPGKALDESCYEEMRNADMVLLVIGGQYGSPAQNEKEDEFKEYISITRKEFRTAVETGIPVFAFVDTNVYAEFGVYEVNIQKIEDGLDLSFRSVKNINVFRFIKEIRNIGNISITEFSKVQDIKDFLSKQWSDMFTTYLQQLKGMHKNEAIKVAVEDIQTLIRKMDVMLDSVGKKILTASGVDEYDNVIKKQEIIHACDVIVESFQYVIRAGIEDWEEKLVELIITGIEKLPYNKLEILIESNKIDECKKYIFDYLNKTNFWIVDFNIKFLLKLPFIQKLLKDEEGKRDLIIEMKKDENFKKLLSSNRCE